MSKIQRISQTHGCQNGTPKVFFHAQNEGGRGHHTLDSAFTQRRARHLTRPLRTCVSLFFLIFSKWMMNAGRGSSGRKGGKGPARERVKRILLRVLLLLAPSSKIPLLPLPRLSNPSRQLLFPLPLHMPGKGVFLLRAVAVRKRSRGEITRRTAWR